MKTLHHFLNQLAVSPEKFFNHYSEKKLSKTPSFYFVILLYIFGTSIDKLDKFYIVSLSHPIFVIFLALIYVIIWFFLESFFYNLRVRWSGGKVDVNLTRSIILYSKIFVHSYLAILFLGILVYMFTSIFDQIPKFLFSVVIYTAMILYIALYMHSVYISFRTITHLSDVNKKRAIFWFLLLPMCIGVIAIIFMITGFLPN